MNNNGGKDWVKARAGSRGWLTRAAKALRQACTDARKPFAVSAASKVALEAAVNDFDRHLISLEKVQAEVELTLSPEQLEKDIDEAFDFVCDANKARQAAVVLLDEIARDSNEGSSKVKDDFGDAYSSHGSDRGGGSGSVRLPKLQLPKFSGTITEWQSFWDQFEALVDDNDNIPQISKFSYLQSLLEGEAKNVIRGLSVTEDNYSVACHLLQERYGRKERVVFAHVQALLQTSMPSPGQAKGTSSKVSLLWRLQDELLLHIRSLESLGIDGVQYGFLMTPLILSRLPNDIRMEWARDGEGKEADLEYLLDFLKKEITRRERSETFKVLASSGGKSENSTGSLGNEEKPGLIPTASALQSSVVEKGGCGVCGQNHGTENCRNLLRLSHEERHSKVQSSKLCFRCLGKSHFAKGCLARCSKCKGRHHALLCTNGKPRPPKPETVEKGEIKTELRKTSSAETKVNVKNEKTIDQQMHSTCVSGHTKVNTVLQTATVRVQGEQGCAEATLLFDSGSQRSYITSSMVKKVKPKWVTSEPISYAVFGGGKPSKEVIRDVYSFQLQGKYGESILVSATEVPVICNPLHRPLVPCEFLSLLGSDLEMADDTSVNEKIRIDILIGLDLYWKLMIPQSVRQVEGLVAQKSVFGWILSGSFPHHSCNVATPETAMLCFDDIPESRLRSFWDLESIGISNSPLELDSKDPKLDPVFQIFSETVKRSPDGRYEVSLPWKQDDIKSKLLNNKSLARKRLHNLSRRFAKDPDLQDRYNAVFKEYEDSGFIVEVPPDELDSPNPTFYLPHRPVIREDSLTTKVRPVFDASATGYNGVSLNDCLHTGPSLIPNLVEILIRFRRWPIALTADVTKAFLQLMVRREDQDVHRFLLDSGDGNVRVMRFTRVPFGNRASPFLLNATLRHHFSTYPPSEVVQELEDNTYVDDLLSGCDNDVEGCDMFDRARDIVGEAKMDFAKCKSNSKALEDKFRVDFGSKHLDCDSAKVLGMMWLSQEDCFIFEGISVPAPLEIACSKRVVLSFTARLFDPLGLLTPFTMVVKILFQEIWRLGLHWDDDLPSELKSRFLAWLEGLDVVKQWQIPRCYTSGLAWKTLVGIELHAFGDASPQGYGACVYLRVLRSDGTYEVSLVISKAKVAPLKPLMSLPRLELLGSLLCARLVIFTRSALKLPDTTPYQCYTDSQVALAWIQGDASRWKCFVANRVSEIKQLTLPGSWLHCPGLENPADLVTRGLTAQQLVSSELWMHGPDWLQKGSRPGGGLIDVEADLVDTQLLAESSILVVKQPSEPVQIFDFERWGTYRKMHNIVGLVLRFCHNLRAAAGDRKFGALSQEELSKAQVVLFKQVQSASYHSDIVSLNEGKSLPKGSPLGSLDPFVDNEGLLRMKGRLQFSELGFESKHPIILPKGHVSQKLVSFQHFFMKHAGVTTMLSTLRSNYWIVGVRQMAKQLAGPIRLLLAYCKEEFEDKRYVCGDGPEFDRSCWTSVKHTLGLPFSNLPYYIDGDIKIIQSNAICRYIARKHDLCGKTEQERVAVDILENQLMDLRNGFVRLCYGPNFEDNKKTYLESTLPASLTAFSDYLKDNKFLAGDQVTFVDFIAYELFDQHLAMCSTAFDKFKNLKDFHARVRALPEIDAYYKSPTFGNGCPINNKAAKFK